MTQKNVMFGINIIIPPSRETEVGGWEVDLVGGAELRKHLGSQQ